jgi:hypothetical protein
METLAPELWWVGLPMLPGRWPRLPPGQPLQGVEDAHAVDTSSIRHLDTGLKILSTPDHCHPVLENHLEPIDLRKCRVLLEDLIGFEAMGGDALEKPWPIIRPQVLVRKLARPKVERLVLHLGEKGDLVVGREGSAEKVSGSVRTLHRMARQGSGVRLVPG